jgi:hypothetical protein
MNNHCKIQIIKEGYFFSGACSPDIKSGKLEDVYIERFLGNLTKSKDIFSQICFLMVHLYHRIKKKTYFPHVHLRFPIDTKIKNLFRIHSMIIQ